MKKIVLIGFALISVNISYSQVCFETPIDFEAGDYPHSICSDDFNGDGIPDLIVTNDSSFNFYMLPGIGNGTFGTPLITANSETYPCTLYKSVVSGDFDGDGNRDLAISRFFFEDGINIFKGNGDGTFILGDTLYTYASMTMNRIAAADLNEDGKTDIVALTEYPTWIVTIQVFMANNGGNFNNPFGFYSSASYPRGLALTDMNNDNHIDIVTGMNGFLDVRLGNGVGGFVNGAGFTGSTGNLKNIHHGDMNEDGNEDIVIADGNSASVKVAYGNGLGGFTSISSYSVADSNLAVHVADYNNDSHLDIATAISSSTNVISVLSGNGTGAFPSINNFSVYVAPNFILGTDLNMDGKTDLVVTNDLHPNNNSSIFLNLPPLLVTASISDTNICPTEMITLTGSGATSYVWSENLNGIPFPAPNTITTYTVTGTTNICSSTATITIHPNQYPPTVIAHASDTAVCEGNPMLLYGSGADTYIWSANSDSVLFPAPATTTIYTVTGTDSNGCYNISTITVVSNAFPPSVVANAIDDTLCWGGQSLTLYGTGADSYNWSTGSDGVPFIGPDSTTTYTVTGYTNGCHATDNISIYVEPSPAQNICVVTTDSASGNHNVVVWEKDYSEEIDSIVIYREFTLNNYQKVGAVHYDSLSLFHDFTANPNTTSYKYKLTGMNSCGIEGALSEYHNSIHLQYLGLGNFQWTYYEIEAMANQVSSYNFYRDDFGTGNFHLVNVIPGNNHTYTDINYNSYPDALYRVDLEWVGAHTCTPSRTEGGTSRSNIKGQVEIGIENNGLESLVQVFPNPSDGIFNIQIPMEIVGGKITVVDALGKLIYSGIIQHLNTRIDLTPIDHGIYFLNISHEQNNFSKKIIKN